MKMEKSNWNIGMRAKFLLWFLCTYSTLTFAQLKPIDSFQLPFAIDKIANDRQGNLYFTSREGVVEKYNTKGELLYHFSPPLKSAAAILAAWQGLRVFLYYDGPQQYLFLNRFLTESEIYSLQRFELSSFAGMATLSADNNLWLINDRDLILRKVDLNSGEVLLENKLNLSLDLSRLSATHLREYQNKLVISDIKEGILIFNNLGIYLETLPIYGVRHFSFSGDHLVYFKEGALFMHDLYQQAEESVELPANDYKNALLQNGVIYAFKGGFVDIFEWKR